MERCTLYRLMLAICLAWIGSGGPASAEDLHSEDTFSGGVQRPVFENDSVPEVARLQKQVLAAPNPTSLAWWTAAQNFAAKVPESQARAFAKELPEGARRDQFLEMLRARSIRDTATLRSQASGGLLTAARDAVAQELRRRESNPDTKLISSNYKLGTDSATDVVQNLLAGDDNYDAEVFARLVGSLNEAQRESLLSRTSIVALSGASAEMIDRVVATIKIAAGQAKPKNEFEQKFASKYQSAVSRNVAFNQTAVAAANGDRAAKAQLRAETENNRVNTADYIAAQRASGNVAGATTLLEAVGGRRSP